MKASILVVGACLALEGCVAALPVAAGALGATSIYAQHRGEPEDYAMQMLKWDCKRLLAELKATREKSKGFNDFMFKDKQRKEVILYDEVRRRNCVTPQS